MAILVTGGGGYIGSVTVELLRSQGEEVVVLDDLKRGHRQALDSSVPLYQGDVGDAALVARIVSEHRIEECIHFAALAYVGESVENPALYFANNVGQGLSLLSSLLAHGVRRFVFSSTCATYGEPHAVPIGEEHAQQPTNPYGWSKLLLERALDSYRAAYGLTFVALRYFNAAGATERHGEHHDPETHLIPLALRTAAGALPSLSVFGSDFETPDGSAVRDYIHVEDLAAAHLLALQHLRNRGVSQFLNLGTGRGYSVLEVIETVRRVTSSPVSFEMKSRRPGDPGRLIALPDKAGQVLGWRPRYSNLGDIVETAWRWHRKFPRGYPPA